MIFSLDVRRARKGDCLLLHFGSKAEPGLAMIDGGPRSVYGTQLRRRLVEIRKARGLADDQPLDIDLLMVSHVDDDHIQGVLDLTRELRTKTAGAPLVRVGGFWHNSFDDVIGNRPDELTAAVAAQFGPASLEGELIDPGIVGSDEDQEVVAATISVLASIEQGHRLRDDAEFLEFPLNPQFGGKLVLAGPEQLEVGDGLTFTVAGPMKPELLKLQEKHDEWLRQHIGKPVAPAAALAAYVDTSVPNLSSIVVLARSGGKSMLLTGDARGDKILEGLEAAAVLEPNKTLHVDVLKVPHHGSANNLARDFFERVIATHYVFSGNGENGNPEREAFAMLFRARKAHPFEIHLTYPLDEIDAARKVDWGLQQAKEKARAAAGGTKPPREDWSPAKHGLVSFFAPGRLASGQHLTIVDPSKPHLIDLIDPLGL